MATAPAGHITEEQVRDVLQSLVGEQLQMPPMFSAKKKNGVPLLQPGLLERIVGRFDSRGRLIVSCTQAER